MSYLQQHMRGGNSEKTTPALTYSMNQIIAKGGVITSQITMKKYYFHTVLKNQLPNITILY